MRVLIVEDEPLAAEKLVDYLRRWRPEARVMAHLTHVQQVVDFLSGTTRLDLIFADIELSDGRIFSALEALDLPCPVIFTTSYSQYWPEAFQSQGVEYLLKPFSYKRFCQAMTNLEQLKEKLAAPFAPLASGGFRQRFMLRKSQAQEVLPVTDIRCFRASGGVVVACDRNGEHHILVESSLSLIEPQLDPEQFFRLNRSDLVHIAVIKRIEPYGKESLAVITDVLEEPLITSRNRTASFRRWLDR
ncbi:LytR/AlgR family response regulator transcription factor [Microbulbifer halophilus]|uniref:LytR/AlgR family response regulator transcription factor n=1 Tax=Microbulbifer halophilus TaxID=453963 RepID=A0ABW5ED89_9GAMM|nr:LytTR family DNA-binding domain-containing protein [Microbulbifer halophilus]